VFNGGLQRGLAINRRTAARRRGQELNRAGYVVRLSKDLRLVNTGGYEFAAKGLGEIGRMTGGWMEERKGGGRVQFERRRQTGVKRSGPAGGNLESTGAFGFASRSRA